jgi:hypothetical protein
VNDDESLSDVSFGSEKIYPKFRDLCLLDSSNNDFHHKISLSQESKEHVTLDKSINFNTSIKNPFEDITLKPSVSHNPFSDVKGVAVFGSISKQSLKSGNSQKNELIRNLNLEISEIEKMDIKSIEDISSSFDDSDKLRDYDEKCLNYLKEIFGRYVNLELIESLIFVDYYDIFFFLVRCF